MKLKNQSIFTAMRTPDYIMPEEDSSNRLGKFLKKLLKERNMSARQLAEAVAITESAMSRIINGGNKPRPKTLAKIARHLARHYGEEQAIINAFHGADIYIPEDGPPVVRADIRSYCERLSEEAWAAKEQVVKVMEHRAAHANFRGVIEKTLQNAGIAYKKDFAQNGAATDFLVELPDGQRWGIESRAEIHRNLAQNFGFAFLVLERLDVQRVMIVTPYSANITHPKDMPSEISVLDFIELGAELKKIDQNQAKSKK